MIKWFLVAGLDSNKSYDSYSEKEGDRNVMSHTQNIRVNSERSEDVSNF